ncbi:MAG: hypothetical protein PUA49_06405 [Butyrivibrio sp.]|nr:hypothetical protein [Butyrivibrio sp.]
MNKKNIGVILSIGIPVIALVFFLVIKFCFFNKTDFNIAQYVLVSFEGFDGRGTATATLDKVGLENAIQQKVDGKDELISDFVKSVGFSVNKQNMLSNGEQIEVIVYFNRDLAGKLSLDIKNFSRTVMAKGLEKGTLLDVFEDVKIITGGVSPYIYAAYDNESEDEYLKSLQYTIDKTYGLAIGDEITITCDLDTRYAASKGYYVDTLEMKYTISEADRYIATADEIDKELVKKLSEESVDTTRKMIEDKTTHMSYKLTKDRNYLYRDNNEEARDLQYVKTLFAVNSSGGQLAHENAVVTVVKGTVALPNYSGSDDPYDYLEGWFGYVYFDAIIKRDGTFSLATNEPEKRLICATSYERLVKILRNEMRNEINISDIKID